MRRYPLKERRRSSALSDNSETKWEYLVLPVDQLDSRLYELGDKGWELAGFHGEDAYFKRRKVTKDDAQLLFDE